MASIKQSYPVLPRGGMVTNIGRQELPARQPGAATRLVNFEPALNGGYRRISGYSKQNTNALPGKGKCLGIHVYFGGVVAARETAAGGTSQIYYSNGVSWQSIGTQRPSRRRFHFHDYYLPDNRLMICDGVGRPAKWDRRTYTELEDAPIGASMSAEHRSHMFFAVGPRLVISQPNDDEGYDPSLGAGEVNLGDEITSLWSFRGQLIIFCQNSIYRLEGRTTFDFTLNTISQNIGCIARDSVQEIAGSLLFLGPDGLRTISSTATTGDFDISIVSDEIRDVVDSVTRQYKDADISSCVIREKTQYRLVCYNPSVQRANTRGIIVGLRKGEQGTMVWEWGELEGIKASCAHSAYAGTREKVVFGNDDDYVYEMEKSEDFDGNPVKEIFKTPHYFFDDSMVRNTLTKIRPYVTSEGNSELSVQIEYDFGKSATKQPATVEYFKDASASVFGTAKFNIDKFAGISTTTTNKYLTGSGYTASLEFTSSNTSSPYTIHSFILEFITRGRA